MAIRMLRCAPRGHGWTAKVRWTARAHLTACSAVLEHRLAHRLGVGLPLACRVLDVGEHERDDSRRELTHCRRLCVGAALFFRSPHADHHPVDVALTALEAQARIEAVR